MPSSKEESTFEENILPRSTIRNIAKTVIKEEASLQKEALTALAKGSTVFVSFLTAQANDNALRRGRKTIMPVDVFDALKSIEFDRFSESLKSEHEKVEASNKEKRRKSKLIPVNKEAELQQTEVDESSTNNSAKRIRTESGEMAVSRVPIESEPMEEEILEVDPEIENEDPEEEEEDEEEEEEDDTMERFGASQNVPPEDPDIVHRPEDYDEALDDGNDSD